MIRLLADENFNGDILRGLQRRVPAIDVPRDQDLVIRALMTRRSWNGQRQSGVWF